MLFVALHDLNAPADLPFGIKKGVLNRREACLGAALALSAASSLALPQKRLEFPRDHGVHLDFRTEWWYLTGWLEAKGSGSAARLFGFQITFFRSRIEGTQGLQSSLAPRHVLLAHVALSDVQSAKLLHADRALRWNGWNGQTANAPTVSAAQASTQTTDLRLRDWLLKRTESGYSTQASTPEFGLDLSLQTTQSILLQGREGLSRKGPEASQASYYYSQPQLAASGRIRIGQGRAAQELQVSGRGWLDHEWSQEIMHPEAVGWDWIGMNLDDGASLTAFQLRRADGSAIWAGGSFRAAGRERAMHFSAGDMRFEASSQAQHHYKSAQTNASYPTVWTIVTPAGRFEVRAQFPAQEMKRGSTPLPVYWEGLSDLYNATGARVGRGYLEMTGYAERLRL